MRLSHLLGKTLREAPADVGDVSLQLALRAALIRRANGTTMYLPLGWRVQQRLRQLARDELNALGGQEAFAEELDIALLAREINSYRDLPKWVYSVAGGAVSTATLQANAADLDTAHRAMYHACLRTFDKCGMKVSAAEAGPGASVFVTPHEKGDESLLVCESVDCGYASVATRAGFRIPEGVNGEPKPLEKVPTPHCPTIAALAEFLNIEAQQTIKAVLYMRDDSEFVFVVIRGDLDVSEPKLLAALGGGTLRPATEAEILKAGAVPGYASPAGLKVAASHKERGPSSVTVVADPSITAGANFAAGANESGCHFINVNYPRDFRVTTMTDIALASDGAVCAQCGSALRTQKAFVIGECRNVGESASTYLGSDGKPQAIWAAECRMDADALMLAIIEQNHDGAGIVWPSAVAPFDIHLVRLGKAQETLQAADKLYADLQAAGREVLYDDRDDSAGVKFADADLIGLPLRVTVSDKSLKAGGAEVKRRNSAEKSVAALESIISMTPSSRTDSSRAR